MSGNCCTTTKGVAVPILLSLDFSSINKLKNHPAVMEYSNFLNDYSPFVSCKVFMNADMTAILLFDYVLTTVDTMLDEIMKQIPNCISNSQRIQEIHYKQVFTEKD